MDFYDLLHPADPRHYGLRRGCPAPREISTINPVSGYRTRRSMQNQQTWDYAQRECGLLWRRWGSTMLVLTVIAMLLFMGEDTDHIGVVGSVITVLQMIPLFLSIVIVEKKLREKFDENGLPR